MEEKAQIQVKVELDDEFVKELLDAFLEHLIKLGLEEYQKGKGKIGKTSN